MRIIVADSSNYTRSRIVRLLSHLTSAVTPFECMSVPETIEACAQSQPDAIIMDYQLIGGNSMDILESIKTEPINPMVIVLTDSLYPQIKRQCFQAGADYVFDKSIEFETIPKVLENCSQALLAAA